MIEKTWARRSTTAAVRWLADRLGFERGEPFVRAARGLARDAEVLFPRDLLPLLALGVGRGLLASQVFQLHADWVWPYWVVRQLDPRDPAYTVRGMSPLWYNLTHRTWTAVGVPGGRLEAIVDPRGLLTPALNGPSLDVGVRVSGELWAPSRLVDGYAQSVAPTMPLVEGRWRAGTLEIETLAWAERIADADVARLVVRARATERAESGALVVSLRPYNPEGPAVVSRIDVEGRIVSAGARPVLVLSRPPDRHFLSSYFEGDAMVSDAPPRDSVRCGVGMATAAAFFDFALQPGEEVTVEAAAFIDPLESTAARATRLAEAIASGGAERPPASLRRAWSAIHEAGARFELPDAELSLRFDQARTTLLVLDDGESIPPGPATYHHVWFRDSAYLVTALGRLGHVASARRKLESYASRQLADGFFRSQDGEWDSNGQAIVTLVEHHRTHHDPELLARSWESIDRGARWIARKRRAGKRPEGARGLFPIGISAEHLGPHDHYYWDDFWGVAGLRAAAHAAAALGHTLRALELSGEADAFFQDIDASLSRAQRRHGRAAMPAAPDRALDAGLIGNVVAAYPLELLAATDERMVDTLRVLEERFFLDDAFLQPLVHSGLNAYLTLHCAEVYLAAGRAHDAWRLLDRVLALATSAGTWAEAIHPRTLGGCMGDGCHGWAAAELVTFVRNAILLEDGDCLRVTPIFPSRFRVGLAVERVPTRFGEVSLRIEPVGSAVLRLDLAPRYRSPPRRIRWRLPADVERAEADGVPVEFAGAVVDAPGSARRVTAWLVS